MQEYYFNVRPHWPISPDLPRSPSGILQYYPGGEFPVQERLSVEHGSLAEAKSYCALSGPKSMFTA